MAQGSPTPPAGGVGGIPPTGAGPPWLSGAPVQPPPLLAATPVAQPTAEQAAKPVQLKGV